MRVGVAGIGNIGGAIARNLARKGFEVFFLPHTNAARAEALARAGAIAVDSPAALARRSEVVVLSLPGSPEVAQVLQGPEGMLAHAHAGLVIIDCGTGEPDRTRALGQEAAARGLHMLDAAVGRTAKEAEEGRLNLMMGGDREVIARVEPVLRAFAENLFHLGPLGAGQSAKLINNYLALLFMASLVQAFEAARASAIDESAFLQVIGKGGLNNGLLQALVPPALAGDPDGLAFGVTTATKDADYCARFLGQLPVDKRLVESMRAFYAESPQQGNVGALFRRPGGGA